MNVDVAPDRKIIRLLLLAPVHERYPLILKAPFCPTFHDIGIPSKCKYDSKPISILNSFCRVCEEGLFSFYTGMNHTPCDCTVTTPPYKDAIPFNPPAVIHQKLPGCFHRG